MKSSFFYFKPCTRVLVCVLLMILVMPLQVTAQHLTDDDLLRRGLSHYNRLPEFVTVYDVETFVEAVKYLYAYLQRQPEHLNDPTYGYYQVWNAYWWLSENVSN